MAVLAAFPDAEAVVMALLEQVAPTVQTTPAEITTPIIQVIRIGGQDDGITDHPLVFVACYGTGADGYTEARAMAEQCRQVVLAAAGTAVTVDGYEKPVLIDSTSTASSPVEAPQDNPELRRKTATFRLTYRRQRA